MTSVSDLGTRALQRLNIISAVETPSAEDAAKAAQKVTDAHAMLQALGKTRWTLTTVPDHIVPAYVECAASLMAPEYGQVGDGAPQWSTGEQMIDRLIALPYVPTEDNAVYVPDYV